MERMTSTVLAAVGHRRGAVFALALAAGSLATDHGHPFPGRPDAGAFERRV